jgi:hypothetical protein
VLFLASGPHGLPATAAVVAIILAGLVYVFSRPSA